MSSVCSSRCISDTINSTNPTNRVRATYVNLHRWPESDAEFIRSLSFRSSSSAGSTSGDHPHHHHHATVLYPPHGPRVVDTISCRQMYLRSYTFTRRKESTSEKTRMWVKEKLVNRKKRKKPKLVEEFDHHHNSNNNKNKKWNEKVREVPCAALKSVFRRLFFCSASIDVVDVYD